LVKDVAAGVAFVGGHLGLWNFANTAVFSNQTRFATLRVTREGIRAASLAAQ
jgi:hypothetical protein